MAEDDDIVGYVARLVTDTELLLNIGSDDGVEVREIFEILDPNTRNVKDPVSGEDLGSLDRIKARVVVARLSEKLSLARIHPSRFTGISGAARILSGDPPQSLLSPSTWPEGVKVRDPIRSTGLILDPPK
jgi:hypothetical protein